MISRNTNVIDAAEREVKGLAPDSERRAELQGALNEYHKSHTAASFDALYNLVNAKSAA